MKNFTITIKGSWLNDPPPELLQKLDSLAKSLVTQVGQIGAAAKESISQDGDGPMVATASIPPPAAPDPDAPPGPKPNPKPAAAEQPKAPAPVAAPGANRPGIQNRGPGRPPIQR
jgi:hypothetical protein